MVDAGLQPLIDYVRERGQAATAEVFDGVTYWTDEQLEEILVEAGVSASVKLVPVSRFSYFTYRLNVARFWWFNATGLTVFNENGVVQTGWTYAPKTGLITFDTQRKSSDVFYVEGQLVQTYQALARLWEQKANQRSHYVNFRGGHNSSNLHQEWEHCVKMQHFYSSKVVKSWNRS